tara:strand:- start:1294 stop:2049 length:756 start_codon:yes stop_codon:yes gene_type:complete
MELKNLPLIKRLIPSLRKNLRLVFRKHTFWTKINNIHYLLDIRQKQDREFYFKKDYEIYNFNYIYKNEFFKNSFIFIDIGSNIGIYTLIVGKNFNNCKQIISIEPILSTFNRLKSNLKKNEINSFTTALNIALSNKDGKAKMKSESKKNQIQLSKYEMSKVGDVEVETKVFDGLYQFEEENIFIKCDVEGHEYKVIEGMKNTLIKNNCLIQIEIFSRNLYNTEKILKDLGYIILNKSKERDTFFFGKKILS